MSDECSRRLCMSWCVPGKPLPQQRHRHRFSGGTWDPSSTHKRNFLRASKQLCPISSPVNVPLRVDMRFVFQRPKSHFTKSGKLTKRAPLHHVQTPDTDNLAKYVLDALSRTYYQDDKQVVVLSVTKLWGDSGATHVRIRSLSTGFSPSDWDD